MMSPSAKSCQTTGLVNALGAAGSVAGGVLGGGVLGGAVVPVHATPLRVKLAGAGLLEPDVPLNPKEALPPVGRLPLYSALVTVTCAPDWLTDPLHSCVMVCPAVKDQPSHQPEIGSPRLSMVTFAPKPPCH